MDIISNFTQPDTAPAYFVDFLDLLDNLPGVQAGRAETVKRLQLAPGHKVLDLGCGTGGATFRFADVVGPDGFAAGVDVSAALIDVANRRVRDRGWVNFRAGDAQAIPHPDGFFDCAYSERVFLYLSDRLAALHEIKRVVRPGGRVCVVDVDFDCTGIYSTDPASTLEMRSALAASIPNRNSAIELPMLAKQAGLSDITIDGYVVTTPYEFLALAMSSGLKKAAAEGVIAHAALEKWLAEQAALQATGDFFQAWLFVRCSGVVPG